MYSMVNPMNMKPRYVYIVKREDIRPIRRHIKKEDPNSKLTLMRTIPSFITDEK